ncbi:DUF1993 family protein [Sphingomonas sp. LHG3406-1]|uniref:DUF1993 domain-containing protein n=1 Tax=Sphingomonas sp. LHG3406-1 TaxID=2804617 RepID=UPI002614BE14|nr:DUF1993 domain-containing protein [Sphingomonas sp. LHG3406-1]
MTPTQLLVPTFRNQLTALLGWLDKAEAHALAHNHAPGDLLAVRLAVDMFPLGTQLRFASFLAQEAVYRLRGEEVPAELLAVRTHGAMRPDEPGTLDDCRAILAQALAFLDGVGETELDAAADRPLAHALPMGMVFDMTGSSYVRDWALPQVGFHVDMAYALLRSAGVPLGKRDYVPHMWAYLRPGTMPAA